DVAAGVVVLAIGWLVAIWPSSRLLETVNELPPGGALLGPLALALLGLVLLVALASAWPAWRAARRPVVRVLRGGDVAPSAGSARFGGAGFFGVGMRLAAA